VRLNPLGVAVASASSSANCLLAIFSIGFLPIISAATVADSQTGLKELTPTEQWVIAQLAAGKEANLGRQFPADRDRKLRGAFLKDLVTGELPGFKPPPPHGVIISGAIFGELINLGAAQIPFHVWLIKCQFNGEAIFSYANVTGGLSFTLSHFLKGAVFHSIKVRDYIEFNGACFEDVAYFAGAEMDSLSAQGAEFRIPHAEFEGIKVRGDADFTRARFEGLASFARSDIGGNFEAGQARFQNSVGFAKLKVEGDASFYRALFEGTAQFAGADISGNFEAGQARFQNKQLAANFYSMKVGGDADFGYASFDGPVAFRNANFDKLHLSGVLWPNAAAQVQMQGMNYKYIDAVAENEPKSHEALLKSAEQWSYTADVYTNLETFFLSHGYRADADEAFIAGKVRERKEYFLSRDWFGWLRSWMLDLLVGYGRQPWRAGIPCSVLVLLGCVLFSPKKMEPQNPDDTPRVYNRFWYSLGLFLPFVDLQSNKVWKPKANQTFLRNYMRVHILLGWILVPLVLAAVTGLLK